MTAKQARDRRQTLIQFLKFGTVGGCGFVIDYTLVHSFIFFLHLAPVWAGLLSYPFTVTFTWAGNRFFTFHDSDHEPFAKQLVKFATVCAIGLVFNRGTYSLVVTQLPQIYAHPFGLPLLDLPTLGLIAGTGMGMFFNFFASKRLVFR